MVRTRLRYLPGPVFFWWWFKDCPLHFFQSYVLLFSRVHKKWHKTKRKLLIRDASLRVNLCRKGETVCVCRLLFVKPQQITSVFLNGKLSNWHTAEERTEAAKKHLFLLSFCRTRREVSSFSRKSARFLFSLSLLACFKKKWPKLAPERFLPHKTLQNDQLYLYYSSRTTNNTITTHHHFRGAQTHTRLFLAALSLSLALFERERALAFISSLSFSKSEIHHLFPLAFG